LHSIAFVQEVEKALHEQLGPLWKLSSDGKELQQAYTCKNFKAALDAINQAGALAEELGHHPDLHLTNWNRVSVHLCTHALGGISINDLIVAAHIDVGVRPTYSDKWLREHADVAAFVSKLSSAPAVATAAPSATTAAAAGAGEATLHVA
jgi:4a-hydroxytetrahydrobiopterin dehydratase